MDITPLDITPVQFDPFRGGEIARTVPSTEPQREILASAYMSEEANTAFNEAVSLRVSGVIDPGTIESALRTIIDRHDALRVTFTRFGDELCITERNDFVLERLDFSETGEPASDARIQSLWLELASTPMNLFEGPLFRAIWIQLGENLGELVLAAHHAVCDGWSFHVILEELSELCCGKTAQDLAKAPSFADFAERQFARAASNADVDFWNKRFESRPPLLDLPVDRGRPALRSFAAARIDHAFDAELAGSIAAAAGRLKASVVNVALAGTAALLHRLTGTSDVVVGLPVARQGTDELPGLVGHCVQLLPIRLQAEPGDSFQDLVGRAKTATLDAREHFDFTFGTLIRDLGLGGDPSRVPLVPVIFNIDQPFGALKLGAASATLRTVPRAAENFEIFLNILPSQNQLVVEATFNSDLFGADTIGSWLAALECLLADGTANPSKAISSLSLSRQCPEIYARLNDTARKHPAGTWLDRLAGATAGAPAAVAVVDRDGELTYGELGRRSSELARLLVQRGAKRGSVVGIHMKRSRELLVVLAAVHKAGAAYLPLDPSFPKSRLSFMLKDSGAQLLLSDVELPAALADLPIETIRLPQTAAGDDASVQLPELGAADLAYVIYTSGSTGRPKGVEVLHGSVANLLDSMATRPGFSSTDTLLAVTTLSFDISVLELLLPLTQGGRVVVAAADETADAARLAELLSGRGVTVMQATPSTWRLLLNDGWSGSKALTALCGGEPLPPAVAAALTGRVRALWNLYGPTETTIWSCCERITPGSGQITIGRPIDNTTAYVMDAHGQALPAAIPGEIWIGGSGLARSYHARSDLTAERFVEHPQFGRLYRTGDRARVLSRGAIEHLGRLDYQVKVRGYRIELGEIEAGLATHSGVVHAVAVTREDQPGDVRLVAYLVARSGATLEEGTLRAHLRTTVPEYMVPQHFVILPAIPLLPNGKFDRKSLPAPETPARPAADRLAPRTELEKAVAAAMEASLSTRGIGVHDSFFALGGHSLLAAQLASRLNRDFSTDFSIRTVFEAPTVARLAEVIATASAAVSTTGRKSITRLADRSHAPLSRMQRRLWILDGLYPGRVVYNAPSAHRLTGVLDERAFEQAFREMVRRQSALRTSFERNGSSVVQRIHDEVSIPLFPVEDLSALPPQERESRLLRRLDELTNESIDLAQPPLFRVRMFRLGDTEHVLFFMAHHIIWDGWSFDLLYEEMSALYGAFSGQRPSPLADLPIGYGDFSAWHEEWTRGPEFGRQLAFWRTRLQQIGQSRRLPTDKPRGPGMSGAGSTVWISVEKQRVEALHKLAQHAEATLFITLLAAYKVLLYGYSRQTNLVVGTPVRGRNGADLEGIMGFFNNLLLLQIDIEPGEGFGDLVRRVKAAVIDVFANPDVPLEQLSRELPGVRAGGSSILYQALFSFQDARQRVTQWGGLRHAPIPLFQRGATEDIGMWFVETSDGVHGGVTYNSDVLAESTAQSLRDRYLAILDAIVAAPDTTIEALSGPRERMLAAPVAGADTFSNRHASDPAVGRGAYVAPRNDLEISLATVWERVLGVENVGVTYNFFELGGNSLSVLNLSLDMAQATGIEIDIGEVFRSPTIAGLVTSLGPDARASASVVVPLHREGDGIPIFCVCGIDIYSEFAASLGTDQPVFGVYVAEEQAIARQVIRGELPQVSIERLVAAYYEAIARFRPHGPYRLAGVSFGGVLALELASQMRERGAEVDAVILLDTLLPQGYRRNWIKWLSRRAAEILDGHARRVVRNALARLRDRLARRLRRSLWNGAKRADDAFTVRQSVAFEEAARKWRPRQSNLDFGVILLRASDHSEWGPHLEFLHDYGWGRYLGKQLSTVDVPGDHLGIMGPPHVAELGQQVRRYLAGRTGRLENSIRGPAGLNRLSAAAMVGSILLMILITLVFVD